MSVTREDIKRTLEIVRDLLERLTSEHHEPIAPYAGSELIMAGDALALAGGTAA